MAIFRDTDPNFANDDKFTQFNKTFNVYNDVEEQVNDLGSSITSADQDFGLLGVLNGLIMAGWQSLRLMLTNFAFMNTVFKGLYTMFGVPAWISGLIILAVTVMFVFSIFSAFFQRDL